MLLSGGEVDFRFLFTGLVKITGGGEGAANAGGIGAVLGGELAIPGGEGEAVIFSNGGMSDDLCLDIEVANHAIDNGELLEVFLAKDGKVGLENIKELEDDGEDAVEVTGAGGAAEVLCEERLADED